LDEGESQRLVPREKKPDRGKRPSRKDEGGGAEPILIRPGLKAQDLAKKIREVTSPALIACGLDLLEVEVKPLARRLLVRAVVDSPQGVGVEDCARFSRQLGDLLDVHDFIAGSYTLEVSSPGLDRPLRKPADFFWAKGKPVKVTLKKPLEGQNVLTGTLMDFDGEVLNLKQGEQVFHLALNQVAKARLDFDPFGRAEPEPPAAGDIRKPKCRS